MGKIYKIKYIIWYDDGDRRVEHERVCSDMVSDLEEAISIARSLISKYISCSDKYIMFELSDQHFIAYRDWCSMAQNDCIQVWVE